MSNSSVNKVILIGNLGRKPELKEVAGGQMAGFSLATSRSWKDKTGEMKDVTTWHRVVVWGNQAGVCAQYLDKGSQVFVDGSLEVREYTDPNGQMQKITEVRAREVKFLGKPRGGEGAPASPTPPPKRSPQNWEDAPDMRQMPRPRSPDYGPPHQEEEIPF